MRIHRRAFARFLLLVAALSAALALWALLTGGFRVYVFGMPLSVRGELRPALVAIVCAIAALALDVALRRRIIRFFRDLRGATVPEATLPTLAAIATVLVLGVGVWYGHRSARGSDSYGYISQAALWRQGDLRVHQDFVSSVPWPDADWTFCPLGYRPAENHTLVPTYAPGLPLLMALFQLVLGSCGPYLVGPACGAALVGLTYGLGARISGRVVGATSALCMAASPTMLMMMLSNMSDVPVATFWTGSLLLACRRTGRSAVASGVMAGVAILIRPNLAPLALGPAAITAWISEREDVRGAAARLLMFGVACAPFALFIGWLFNDLYGSPLRSGYGDTTSLYSWKYLQANLARYPRWLIETQGPLVPLFLLSPFFAARRAENPPLRILLLAFIAGVFASYLFYEPFEAWWFLRFVLPAFPLLFVLAADAVWLGAAWFGQRARIAAILLFGLVMVYYGAGATRSRDILSRGQDDYADAGRYIDRHLPANAVLLAMQHSGSARYHSGRLTMRYDALDPAWLDRALEYLRTAGYEPYFLLQEWEVPIFKERFAGQKSVAALDARPIAITPGPATLIYNTGQWAAVTPPVVIAETSGCEPRAVR